MFKRVSFLVCAAAVAMAEQHDDAKAPEHNPLVFGLRILGLSTKEAITDKQDAFLLLGAGFPRTGTKSTKAGLCTERAREPKAVGCQTS